MDAKSASIAKRLKLDDRIEKLAKKDVFITLKDHKPAFNDHPTCRLINSSKSEIGVVSKHILDEINSAVIHNTQINQWKNTSSVLSWFNGLENKEALSFICFDVCDFYPSINEKLLSKALDFASKTDPSVAVSVTSFYTPNAHCCSAIIPHGRKNPQMTFSTLPWALLTVPKRANWSAATCYPFSLKGMAKTSASIATMA